MKQATTGNKDIIKKLLTDSLSPEEREKLNNYKFVNQAIYSQWEQASDMYTDVDKEERMLTNVMHQIKKGKTGRFRQSLHRYGWVASIALLLICGTLSLMLLSISDIFILLITPLLIYFTADFKLPADIVVISLIIFPSLILNSGKSTLSIPASFAEHTQGSTPLTPLMLPSRLSSPTT